MPTVLTVKSFARDVDDCLRDTKLTVAFQSSNPFNYKDSSRFQIEVPQNVLLPSKEQEMKCRVNNAHDVTCNYTLYAD